MANLEQNKAYHNKLRQKIIFADERIKYFVFGFIIESIFSTLIPMIQIWQLFINKGLTKKHAIALSVIIIASVYVLGYSLYRALVIPSVYISAIELYYLKVAYTPVLTRDSVMGFNEEVSHYLI